MKVKKEYIILAVVIIALSVYLVMRTSDRTQYELPDIPPVVSQRYLQAANYARQGQHRPQ